MGWKLFLESNIVTIKETHTIGTNMLYARGRHNLFTILLTALLAVMFAFGGTSNFSHAHAAMDSLQPTKPIEHPSIEANGVLKLVSRYEYRNKDIYTGRFSGDNNDSPDSALNRSGIHFFRLAIISLPVFIEKPFISGLTDKSGYPRAPPA